VFSKHKSERIPLQKPYDYVIDFMEGTKLTKLAKVYPLALVKRNSLDTWINKELRKGSIYPSTSLMEAYNLLWTTEPLMQLLLKIAIQFLE